MRLNDVVIKEGNNEVQEIISEYVFIKKYVQQERTFDFIFGGNRKRGSCWCNKNNGSSDYDWEDCNCDTDCSCYYHLGKICNDHYNPCECDDDCGCDMNF